ncbi:hypothetical protein JCM6292_2838 [Bacteroides pyogenes JCM 6292]|uniref:Uncharacterized protein n=2 Tax=Bacteroides pyogenes TaxID=310300 RepID=W4PDP3_9BACE|nr:hypothetical protein JCM6292_2838 [Bacteroides pyogenes JCM 6292]GAE17892.1 hypothetical protein JCM6294_703 [Bacteroides pyogenes DSM 20611 = JCM 6294]
MPQSYSSSGGSNTLLVGVFRSTGKKTHPKVGNDDVFFHLRMENTATSSWATV